MFTKSVIGSVLRPALLALSLLTAIPVFAADPTIDQVYQAAVAGKFDDAQAMMDKVLHDHPNSAKAHYVEADLLAKQNRLGEAKTELDNAIRLDPSEKFAKPAALEELKSIIAGPRHVVQTTRPVYSQPAPVYSHPVTRSDEGSGSGLTIIVIVGLVILFFVIVRMMTRRTTVVTGGGYGGGVMQGGYGPGYGPGGVVVNQGGMGSGILGGLATGAAVGAGIVAGEELMHHFTDNERRDTYYNDTPAPSQDSGWNSRNDDMGGNDFGVSDSSSWDSGGGGGGSDDWN